MQDPKVDIMSIYPLLWGTGPEVGPLSGCGETGQTWTFTVVLSGDDLPLVSQSPLPSGRRRTSSTETESPGLLTGTTSQGTSRPTDHDRHNCTRNPVYHGEAPGTEDTVQMTERLGGLGPYRSRAAGTDRLFSLSTH